MRPELHKVEYIEAYIRGKMSPDLLKKFQAELADNPALEKQVELQQQLMQAAKRKALRSDIQSAAGGFGGGSAGMKWALGSGLALVVAIAAVAAFYFLPPASDQQADVLGPIAEQVEDSDAISFNGLQTWVEPEAQHFDIHASEGATIEGAYGTLIIVPTNAFLDTQNQPVTTPVELELVEALTLDQMVLYNLTTMAGSKPLGTGGMLHIQASSNGAEVKINPERPLFIQVPTEEVKPEMMLFKGEVTEAGSVDWKDPKPMERYLIPVDFDELDFLPAGMEAAISSQQKNSKYFASDKPAIDSVYYSLSGAKPESLPVLPARTQPLQVAEETVMPTSRIVDGKFISDFSEPVAQPMQRQYKKTVGEQMDSTSESTVCGIDPLSIQAIRNNEFAQTLIATKPFEERIQYLHGIRSGQKALNSYLENLGKPLYWIDSLVATQLRGNEQVRMKAFAKERYGNVKGLELYQERLSAYYNERMRESRTALDVKRSKMKKASQEELRAQLSTLEKERTRQENLIRQEIVESRSSAAAQTASNNANSSNQSAQPNSAPARSINARNVVNSPSYSFQWASLGWLNIDQYLKTLTDNPLYVKIEVQKAKQAVQLYQWINAMASLTPLVMNGNQGVAAFPPKNARVSYKMMHTHAIAIDRVGNDFFWGMSEYYPYETEKLSLEVVPIALAELKHKLKILSGNNAPLIKSLKTEEEEIAEQMHRLAEQKKRMKEWNDKLEGVQREYTEEKRRVIASKRAQIQRENNALQELLDLTRCCEVLDEKLIFEDPLMDEAREVWTLNELPAFPGGESSFQAFLKQEMTYPPEALQLGISGNVYVEFIVNSDGSISDARVIRSVHPSFNEEAIRIVESMPNWNPGMKDGKPVAVSFKLPIRFTLK